jgi:hypothetical protein
MLRRAGLGVTVAGAALLLGAAPAGAARQVTRLTTSAQGELVVGWHGDHAAGCADRGTCAFSGTYELPIGGGATQSEQVSGNATLPPQIQLDSGQPTVVRARRDAPGGPGLCVDVVSSDLSGVSLVQAPGRRLALQPGGLAGAASGPLAGRCAGPLFSDLPTGFPTVQAPARLGSKPVTLDFSGRRAFSAGGWSGEVTSTVKVTLTVTRHAAPRSERIPRAIRAYLAKRRSIQFVTLEYRAQQVAAGLGVAFRGLPDPACEPFDACGASGTASWSIGGPVAKGPLILLSAERRLRPGEPRDLASALRALREGQMHVTGGGDLGSNGRAQSAEQLPGGGSCSDSTPAGAPSLNVASRRGRVSFAFGGPQELSPELFRTRCPGPLLADAFGQGETLVVGRVPERVLAARTLRVGGQSAGGFTGSGYLGSRRATLLLVLRRVRARVEPVGVGAP